MLSGLDVTGLGNSILSSSATLGFGLGLGLRFGHLLLYSRTFEIIHFELEIF